MFLEYDPTQPPKLSERVLKDKRRKLKETFERVLRMYVSIFWVGASEEELYF